MAWLIYYTFFYISKLETEYSFLHKNVRAQMNQNFNNILSKYPGWEQVENVFIFVGSALRTNS